jgi:hypothetical protein
VHGPQSIEGARGWEGAVGARAGRGAACARGRGVHASLTPIPVNVSGIQGAHIAGPRAVRVGHDNHNREHGPGPSLIQIVAAHQVPAGAAHNVHVCTTQGDDAGVCEKGVWGVGWGGVGWGKAGAEPVRGHMGHGDWRGVWCSVWCAGCAGNGERAVCRCTPPS